MIRGAPTVNPDEHGTKAAFWYQVTLAAGATTALSLRLAPQAAAARHDVFGDGFERVLVQRRAEADAFYAALAPRGTSAEDAEIMRQASPACSGASSSTATTSDAGSTATPDSPLPHQNADPGATRTGATWTPTTSCRCPTRGSTRGSPPGTPRSTPSHWPTSTRAFAKYHLVLLCREWFQHPDGAIPAYEWAFDDLNPPVQAWAAMQVFDIDGRRDLHFLMRVFSKLLLNFSGGSTGRTPFVHCIDRHASVTADLDTVADLADVMDEILDRHLHGTRYGISADPDDVLLRQGQEGVALTWMDARVDGRPVTGRRGKAVEINALWINALAATAKLFAELGRPNDRAGLAERASTSFQRRFPRPDGAGLLDVVDGPAGDDASVRPNQLLAVSLPHAPTDDPSVVDVCRTSLLTSIGLRSLAPDAPGYRGRHRGGPAERDRAYHQGTVWPWLIGPFVDAARRVGADVADLPDGLELHLGEWGLGSVSETADGDPPHDATGCPFQAWSAAEVLRARRTV